MFVGRAQRASDTPHRRISAFAAPRANSAARARQPLEQSIRPGTPSYRRREQQSVREHTPTRCARSLLGRRPNKTQQATQQMLQPCWNSQIECPLSCSGIPSLDWDPDDAQLEDKGTSKEQPLAGHSVLV